MAHMAQDGSQVYIMLIVLFPGPHQASLECCKKRWVGPGNEADNTNELEYCFGKSVITTKCKVQSHANLNQ